MFFFLFNRFAHSAGPYCSIAGTCLRARGGLWGASCGRLGASWRLLRGLLRASWGPMGASWGPLGASWEPLRTEGSKCCFVFPLWGPSWGVLGALLGRLGGLLGRLKAILGRLEAILGRLGGILGYLGGFGGLPGPPWEPSWAFWTPWRAPGACLGADRASERGGDAVNYPLPGGWGGP